MLRSQTVFDKAWSSTTGSAQPTVPLRAIRELPVPLPSLVEQLLWRTLMYFKLKQGCSRACRQRRQRSLMHFCRRCCQRHSPVKSDLPTRSWNSVYRCAPLITAAYNEIGALDEEVPKPLQPTRFVLQSILSYPGKSLLHLTSRSNT